MVISKGCFMKEINPIRNQEISTIIERARLNKLKQVKKSSPKIQIHLPDSVVISRMVQAMNNYLNTVGKSDVKIKIYKVNGEITVCAVSKKQGRIIKTISPEKLLNLNNGIREMVGLFISAVA